MILQQALYGHCILEPNLLQLFYGIHRRSHCYDFPPAFVEHSVQFLQCRGFPRPRSAPDIDSQVTTSQNELNGLLLLRPQLARQLDFDTAQGIELADAAINAVNHAPFSLKSFAGSYVFSCAEQFATTFLKCKTALEFI